MCARMHAVYIYTSLLVTDIAVRRDRQWRIQTIRYTNPYRLKLEGWRPLLKVTLEGFTKVHTKTER